MRKKSAVALVVLMLCALMGCGKKEVDYVDSTEGQTTQEQIAVKEEEIPEFIEYKVSGEQGDVTVYADVILPENYSKCTVMEFTDDDFTDEDIKNIADTLFDEGSHFLYMPYNEEEISYAKDKLTAYYEASTDEMELLAFEDTFTYLDTKLVNYNLDDNTEYEEYKFYQLGDTREQNCEVFGTIDGVNYLLSFRKDDNNCYMLLTRWKNTVGFKIYDVGAESLDVKIEGNLSTYSMEEAEKIAREYVEMLGYTDFDVIQTNNVRYDYRDPSTLMLEYGVEGYNVYFGRSYDNYALTYSSYNFQNNFDILIPDENGNVNTVEGYEFIRVYVDSEGVCQLEVYNPMKYEGTLSEQTVMLPYETIDSVAKEYMKNNRDSSSGIISVREVELGYGMTRTNGRIALVPTWYYFQGEYDNETRYARNVFLKINAIDGTLILQ